MVIDKILIKFEQRYFFLTLKIFIFKRKSFSFQNEYYAS